MPYEVFSVKSLKLSIHLKTISFSFSEINVRLINKFNFILFFTLEFYFNLKNINFIYIC